MEIIHENEYLYRMNKEAEPYLELHRQEKYVSNAENFIRGKNKDFSRKNDGFERSCRFLIE